MKVDLKCPACGDELDAYLDTSSLDGQIYDGITFGCASCGADGAFVQFGEDDDLEAIIKPVLFENDDADEEDDGP